MMDQLSNYDKYPVVKVSGCTDGCWQGWGDIGVEINRYISGYTKPVKKVVIECYPGVLDKELVEALSVALGDEYFFFSSDAMLSQQEINDFFSEDITTDEVFGYLTRHTIDKFFDPKKVSELRKQISAVKEGVISIYGTGAAYICPDADVLIYADMPRWEIQQRFRRNEISNLGIENRNERPSLQYKRSFFVDWRVCDRFKKTIMDRWDYLLDTTLLGSPKMVTGENIRRGLQKALTTPFRVVPFFDPGPWGGQWMKKVIGLDESVPNYAWCFDCVPEENSLLLGFGDMTIEIPSVNLVFAYPRDLLGVPVYGRFGDEFPIRFDFLDTIGEET